MQHAAPATIINGILLADGELQPANLSIADGRLVERAPDNARTFDARSLLVLPGIVDIHGDAFERQIMPRPGVTFPIKLALLETDRQLVANGITTAYHGLTVSWEPGLRSIDNARRFVIEWRELRRTLQCDTRLHLRWETYALEAAGLVASWLELDPAPILAFNDHTTPLLEGNHSPRALEKAAERAGLTTHAYDTLLQSIGARAARVPETVAALAGKATQHGAVKLAHDERSAGERASYRALGAVASEFPMNTETATAARAAGEHTIFGAPNVVRGGSHNNSLNASQAIADGLCTVLASDYYYPAPLLAPFVLEQRGEMTLNSAWDLVSKHPAEVAGLSDRGALRSGLRADVVVIDPQLTGQPRVVATFVEGRCVYQSGDVHWIG